MVGIASFSFGPGLFSGVNGMLVSGRVLSEKKQSNPLYNTLSLGREIQNLGLFNQKWLETHGNL